MVTLDIKDYIDETNRQLNNTNNYKRTIRLRSNRVTYWKNKIRNKQLKNENLLTLKTANSLLDEKIKTAEFHVLPKIHEVNNPRRPVIFKICCYLQPEVKKLKSSVKDTTDFIKKIEPIDQVSDDSDLVSLEVYLKTYFDT